jgi:hypothetical protein
MSEEQRIDISVVPSALSQLVHVNVEYGVLVCLGSGYSRAVREAGFLEHVRKNAVCRCAKSKPRHPLYAQGCRCTATVSCTNTLIVG